MDIILKKMETEQEIKGKAFVHWKAWHEAYPGLISQEYLDAFTLSKCEKIAFDWRDNIIIAIDGDKVVGYVGYGEHIEEAQKVGEIVALYVLSEYYGTGLGLRLIQAALDHLTSYREVILWVLKGNQRAIHFYEKCGFVSTEDELFSSGIAAAEVKMKLVH